MRDPSAQGARRSALGPDVCAQSHLCRHPVLQPEGAGRRNHRRRQATDPRRVEIVVVDYGSDDPESLRFLENIEQRKPPRVTVLHHQENRGPAAARNTGFRHSRGRYVVPLDSDDLLRSNSSVRGRQVNGMGARSLSHRTKFGPFDHYILCNSYSSCLDVV